MALAVLRRCSVHLRRDLVPHLPKSFVEDTALHALKRTTTKQCGADKPSEEIVFSTPSGDTTYYDDFYFCDTSDGKIYVSGIDDVLAELGKLAR